MVVVAVVALGVTVAVNVCTLVVVVGSTNGTVIVLVTVAQEAEDEEEDFCTAGATSRAFNLALGPLSSSWL